MELYSHVPVMRNVLDQLKVSMVEWVMPCFCTRLVASLHRPLSTPENVMVPTLLLAICMVGNGRTVVFLSAHTPQPAVLTF